MIIAARERQGRRVAAVAVVVEDCDQQHLALLSIVQDFPRETQPATVNISITFGVDILNKLLKSHLGVGCF